MIKIERTKEDPEIDVYKSKRSTALDGVTKVTKYTKEREGAIAFFTDPNNYADNKKLTRKSFSLKVYKDDDLADALKAVFGKKCAYCESIYVMVSSADVEHFRPKSAIRTDDGELKPGYYWMAGDWNNLLLSCPDCNRSRTHSVPGQTEGVVLGKSTQFPLADENLRVRHHDDDLADEEPARLLIDPCVEDPEEHFMYDEDGNIRARDLNGTPSEMAKASIDVYALRRGELVHARAEVILRLRGDIRMLSRLVTLHNLAQPGSTEHTETKDMIAEELSGLVRQFMKDAPYLGIKRDWIRNADAAGELATIREFGIDPADLLAIR